QFVRMEFGGEAVLLACPQDPFALLRRKYALLAKDIAEAGQPPPRDFGDRLLDDPGDISLRLLPFGYAVRPQERRHDFHRLPPAYHAQRFQLTDLRFEIQPIAALRLYGRGAMLQHRS